MLFWFSLLCFTAAQKIPADIPREVIAPLIDPAKVATLKGDRPANARLYKVLYWLETARRDGAVVAVAVLAVDCLQAVVADAEMIRYQTQNPRQVFTGRGFLIAE